MHMCSTLTQKQLRCSGACLVCAGVGDREVMLGAVGQESLSQHVDYLSLPLAWLFAFPS